MILTERACIFCNSQDTDVHPAKLSPFIGERIENVNDECFNLLHCKNCGSAFFDYRYDEDEISKIYHKYRGEEYQAMRQKYESWYSPEINRLIGDDKQAIASRNANLSKILKNIPLNNVQSVLDFGGDKGQYIPEVLNDKNRYVYDISNVDVLEGITSLRTLQSCYEKEPGGYDLIICAHVLEHLSDPNEVIQELKSLLSKNGYLYIEVPFDSPFYKNPLDNFQYLFNKYFKFTDLVKKYFELKTAKYSLMHEHINFYTQEGLNYLFQENGFKNLYTATSRVYSVIGMSRIISALYSL